MGTTTTNSTQPFPQQSCERLNGSIAILWDIENCPVPSEVRPEDVAGNIRLALRVHPVIEGAVILFSAYGDFNAFPRRLREGCRRTGVNLVDVPNGRKNAADNAILVDMFLFAWDNPPPSTIMLISGDVDYAPFLHILGQRGYTVILAFPYGQRVSAALSNAGRFIWDWPSMARGEGIFSPARAFDSSCRDPSKSSKSHVGCFSNENSDCKNEEEVIVFRGLSQSCSNRDFSEKSPSEFNTLSISEPSSQASTKSFTLPSDLALSISEPCSQVSTKSFSPPSDLDGVSVRPIPSCKQNGLMWVISGDLNGLKAKIVYVLELTGECLLISRVHAKFYELFRKQLCLADYGVSKLRTALKKMDDKISIEGKGPERFIYLRNSLACRNAPPFDLAMNGKKENGSLKDKDDFVSGIGSLNGFIGPKCVIQEDPDFSVLSPVPFNRKLISMPCFQATSRPFNLLSGLSEPVALCEEKDLVWVQRGDLNVLKAQLIHVLELCGQHLILSRIPIEYRKIFGRPLNVSEYGASKLLNLFKMMADKFFVGGEAPKIYVHLLNSTTQPSAPPLDLTRNDKIGNGAREVYAVTRVASLGNFSDDKSVVLEDSDDQSLEQFRDELQEILASYTCPIFIGCFGEIYWQRYRKQLDYQTFRMNNLEELFEKLKDVVTLREESESKRKFLVATPSAPHLDLSKNGRKGNLTGEDKVYAVTGLGSLDEFSDDKHVILEDLDNLDDQSFEQFRCELLEILAFYSCPIFVRCFEAIYWQRSKKQLDCQKFGIKNLEGLFEKLKDVVALREDLKSKRKFLVAAGC